MQINTKTKFNIGQEVYTIRKARQELICPACNGEGCKTINKNSFYCVECSGKGIKYGSKKYEPIGMGIVTLIKAVMQPKDENELETVITYNVKFGQRTYKNIPEHLLFISGEQAIKYCAELNEKLEGTNSEEN